MFQHLHLLFKIQHFTRINLVVLSNKLVRILRKIIFLCHHSILHKLCFYVLSIIRWLLVNKISKYWNNRYISILMMQLYIIRKTINFNETIKQPMVATFFNFIFRMSTVSICSPAYAY